jgi:hypothetical protein
MISSNRQGLRTDTHRQGLADQSPGDRIEVRTIDHVSLGVDDPVDHRGGVERSLGQGEKERLFLRVAVQRARPGLTVDAHVSDLGQPPGRRLVEMLQRVEAPAIEQAGFDISKRPLDFPFGLGSPHPAGHGSKAVMGGKRQEPRVVDRFVAVVATHDHFHVVIKASRRDATEMLEGADVLADGGSEILAVDDVEVLPPRVTQHLAEGMDPAAALDGEIQVVRRVIHWGLSPLGGLEPPHRRDQRAGT